MLQEGSFLHILGSTGTFYWLEVLGVNIILWGDLLFEKLIKLCYFIFECRKVSVGYKYMYCFIKLNKRCFNGKREHMVIGEVPHDYYLSCKKV